MIENSIEITPKTITVTKILKLTPKHKKILKELDTMGYLEYRIYDFAKARRHQKYIQPYIHELRDMGLIEQDYDAYHETYIKISK